MSRLQKRVMSMLALACMLTIGIQGFTFFRVEAFSGGTVFIRRDGTVEPIDAPIARDRDVYTLTDNITIEGDLDGIFIERDDMILEGAGYTIEGTGSGRGIRLYYEITDPVWAQFQVSNVTVRNTIVQGFANGIVVSWGYGETISGNRISDCGRGVVVECGHNHYGDAFPSDSINVTGNDIATSSCGVEFDASINSTVSHNDITATNGDAVRLSPGFGAEWICIVCSDNSITENNIVAESGDAVKLSGAVSNRLDTNNMRASNGNGINLMYVDVGIPPPEGWAYNSSANIVTDNNFEVDNGYSLQLLNSSDNVFYHNNFVNSGPQAHVENSINTTWDNGYPSSGNYWSDYTGTDLYHGPLQNMFGADGIGDWPYFVGEFDVDHDHYPFIVANNRITVSNTVEGAIPQDPWKYTIADASTEALMDNFTLPAAGGGKFSSRARAHVGHFYSITQGGVTQIVEPIQGEVSALDFYAYDVEIGSGFAPYMETGKTKIYLYERTADGELYLIIHHNNYSGPVNFLVNMTLTGTPLMAVVLLKDDPTPEDIFDVAWEAGGGVAFGYWSGSNESDGGIMSGLEYPEFDLWNITAQMLYTSGISAWEYQNASGPIALNMAEPLTISSFEAPIGNNYMIAQNRKLGYDTTITVNGTVVTPIIENFTVMTLVSLGPDDAISVVFSNIPSAAQGKTASPGDQSPSVAWTYNLPCRVPIPVQAAMGPDINEDGTIDLVKDKPTVIFVNITDVRGAVPDKSCVNVSVSASPSGLFIPLSLIITDLAKDNMTIFHPNAPSNTGNYEITCAISYGPSPAGPWSDLDPNDRHSSVTVKDTFELALYYACLNRTGDYGTENEKYYAYTLGNATDFINSTYPVPKLTVDTDYRNLLGNQSTPGSFLGILKDCQWLAQLAKLKFPNSVAVGIGIGPNTTVSKTYKNYFAYHGATDAKGNVAVGVSFGPGTRGVVVMDGYYTAAAHELAHTFNLYYGVAEQYITDYPGKTTNGFNVMMNQYRMGYDFMGLAPYRTTNITWVNTDSTFEYLFRNTTIDKSDPEILLVNGIIYQNGTVEFPLAWYHLQEGTPDTLPPGDFALRFVDSNNNTLAETSFDAPFYMMMDPGVGVGEDLPDVSGFGKVRTDFAGFAFATAYPRGTAAVQLVNMTDPQNQTVIGMVNVPDIVFLPETAETHTGTEGTNGWYTSNVDVTLAATATLGVKEIHYTLDGTPNVIPGATATFTISTEGTHSLGYWAVDNSGNIETPHSQTVRIDKNPPTVELTLPLPLLNEPASANWTATDSVSGVDGPTSGTVLIDTSSVGPKTVTVTVKDYAGNSVTVTETCYVTYAFGGFLEPINPDGSSIFKLGSTVPVKFQLKDVQGNSISTAVARIYLTKLTSIVTGDEVEPISTSAATTGNLLRYDSTSNQYIFNLGTKTLSRGTWQIKVVLDDGTTKTVLISLR